MNTATSKLPLVSVVIPAFNEERNITLCLESVAKQSYSNIEAVIVNDKSTDRTAEVANEAANRMNLDLQIISPDIHQERGIVRNLGAKNANGKYLLFIDADMQLKTDVVKECIESVISGVDGVIIPETSIGEGFWAQCKALEKRCYQGDDRIEAARFFDREKFWSIGGWDQSMISGEDWDLTQRFRAKYLIGRTNSHILHNEGNLSLIKALKKKFYYASKSEAFLNKHPLKAADCLLFALRPAYFKNWRLLIADPIHALGMISLKFMEFAAGSMGLLSVKLGRHG